jgi:N-ethylmaleimide reductase
VHRWQNGLELAEWDEETFFTAGPRGLTDYPLAT